MSEVVHSVIRKARKQHICFGCLEKIMPGDLYERAFVIDGKGFTTKICSDCLEYLSSWDCVDDEFGRGDLRERFNVEE